MLSEDQVIEEIVFVFKLHLQKENWKLFLEISHFMDSFVTTQLGKLYYSQQHNVWIVISNIMNKFIFVFYS